MKKKKKDKKVDFKSHKDVPMMPMSVGSMLYNKTGAWRNIRPVIDIDNCLQCGICWKFCPDACILIKDEEPVIDYDYCKGCIICAEECPRDAISVVKVE